MSSSDQGLGRIAFHGGIVTGTAQAIKIGIQLASVVILARLLLPEDFGLVAAVGPIIAFVGLFQHLGLNQAIIQKKEIVQADLNRVFWVTAAIGLVCALLVVLVSRGVASFYGDERIGPITIAAAVPMFLGSLAATPLSLMNRQLKFNQLAINDVVAAVVGLVSAAGGAYAGFGYWSLLIGSAASAVSVLVAAWLAAQWTPDRPAFRLDPQMLSFGANLTGFNFVNFFARHLDNVLIGKYSGAVELGYYDRAYKLVLFPLQNINQPLSRIMIPLLSRVQDDKARFRDIYMRTNWILAALTMPGVAALTIASEQVVSLLFGERWLPTAPIFSWLGIAALIQPISSTTGWILICQGKTGMMFRWGIVSSGITVASFVVGLQWGAVGVAAAYAISGYVLRLPALAMLVQKVGPVTATDFLLVQGAFLFTSALAWFAFEALPADFTGQSNLAAIICALVLSYAAALALVLVLSPPRQAVFSVLSNLTARPEKA